MKLFSLLLVAVSFAGVSCERHEFDGPNGTRQLHEHHVPAGSNEGHVGPDHAEEQADAPAH